ncbi:hypothetical protein [Sharpea azabuensis]|nr:hypothetical protein [Sharpea azabuensis]
MNGNESLEILELQNTSKNIDEFVNNSLEVYGDPQTADDVIAAICA